MASGHVSITQELLTSSAPHILTRTTPKSASRLPAPPHPVQIPAPCPTCAAITHGCRQTQHLAGTAAGRY